MGGLSNKESSLEPEGLWFHSFILWRSRRRSSARRLRTFGQNKAVAESLFLQQPKVVSVWCWNPGLLRINEIKWLNDIKCIRSRDRASSSYLLLACCRKVESLNDVDVICSKLHDHSKFLEVDPLGISDKGLKPLSKTDMRKTNDTALAQNQKQKILSWLGIWLGIIAIGLIPLLFARLIFSLRPCRHSQCQRTPGKSMEHLWKSSLIKLFGELILSIPLVLQRLTRSKKTRELHTTWWFIGLSFIEHCTS